MSEDTAVKAVVQKIIKSGNHGPFAVAKGEGIEGSVTFSLSKEVWKEPDWPEPGVYVILHKLQKKRAGWRAVQARFLKPNDQQTANRKEHVVGTVGTFLSKWKSKYFPSRDDKAWNAWVDFCDQGQQGLRNLLYNREIQMGFRARALFILLAPNLAAVPFYYADRNVSDYDRLSDIEIDTLPPSLQVLAYELVTMFYTQAKRQRKMGLLSDYNKYVRQLLRVLPVETAEVIFPLYDVYDRSSRERVEYPKWDFQPLGDILDDLQIAMMWKRSADLQAQRIVLEDLANNWPTEQRKTALYAYADTIRYRLYDKTLGYSDSMLFDQVQFLLAVKPPDWTGYALISDHHLARILKAMRLQGVFSKANLLAQSVLDRVEDPFRIYNSETFEAAKLMREVVLDGDQAVRLREMIKKAELGYAKAKIEREKENMREREIFQRMKVTT